MPRYIAQKHTDFTRRVRDAMQRPSSEVGDAAALLEFEHESESRRLARSRRTEECGEAA
jgi:hypothetical protein